MVIYQIEFPPVFGPRAAARMNSLKAAGDRVAVGDLSRMECRVQPLNAADRPLLARFDAYFARPDIIVLPLSAAVCERAASIRARHRSRTPDALHLAAAIIGGCDLFLTNDAHLAACTDIGVEVLA